MNKQAGNLKSNELSTRVFRILTKATILYESMIHIKNCLEIACTSAF